MRPALHPATPGALPKELVAAAADQFGRPDVVEWCEELLAGRVGVDDPGHPDIAWLGGTIGWADYWARVWGARGLLHLGPARPDLVLAGLSDEHWRVREMCLKVVRRHGLEDPDGLVDALVGDPIERVRVQAWATLGVPADLRPEPADG